MSSARTLRDLIEPPRAGYWGLSAKTTSAPVPCRVVRNGDVGHDGSINVEALPTRWFSNAEISNAQIDQQDSVLVSSGAYTGNVGRLSGSAGMPVVISNFVRLLRANSSTVPGFLYHFARSAIAQRHVWPNTGGSAIPNLSSLFYSSVVLPNFFSKQIQASIVRILDTLDTSIHEAEALIAKLKAVKQGLLHDLVTRGIDANGELRPSPAEAPHLYKPSLLGQIPNEWDIFPTIARCILITKGTTPSAHDMWQASEGIRFLRVDNLTFDGQFDWNASTFRVSKATHNGYLARSKCLPGDVLTNIVGPPLGKLGLVTEESGEININQAIALFRPTEKLLPRFLLIWLSSGISQAWLRKRAKQTSGQVNLTLALCQELPLPCMGLTEQQAIVDRFQSVQERICLEEDHLQKMRFEKAGLMDDLLTGRVRVTPLLAKAAQQEGSA